MNDFEWKRSVVGIPTFAEGEIILAHRASMLKVENAEKLKGF